MRNRKSNLKNLICYLIVFKLITKETQSLRNSTVTPWPSSNHFKQKMLNPLSAFDDVSTFCKLPYNKSSIIVTNAESNESVELGTEISKNTPLLFACKTGYYLKGINNTICGAGGRWIKNLPSCISYCPGHHPRSGFSTKAYFELNGADVSYDPQFEVDTIAKIVCTKSFKKPANFENTLTCTENGWWKTKIACEMECGQPVAPITPFSRHGIDAKITEVPWHVNIYQEENEVYQHICCGVLISPRVVVSAAHCFFEAERNRLRTDFSNFAVVFGKYYRDFNKEKELNISSIIVRKILDIWTPNDYTGKSSYYFGDLAILTLSQFVPFSDAIRPVCLFVGGEFNDDLLNGLTGKVSTYDQNSFKERSSVLKTLLMSAISLQKCKEALPNDLKNKLPADKFCLASYNEAAVACKGDSGSGFVAKMPNTNEFVLYGIISFSPEPTRECARHNLLVMTNVLYYQEKLEQFKREDLNNDVDGFEEQLSEHYDVKGKTCKVPNNTNFMIIKNYDTGEIVRQGFNAPMNTFYSISCTSDYVLNGSSTATCRPNGNWLENFPECIVQQKSKNEDRTTFETYCKVPANRRFLKIQDASSGDLIPLGSILPINTTLEFSCDAGFKLKGDNSTICIEGNQWLHEIPECLFVCSDKHPRSGFSTEPYFEFNGENVSNETSFEIGTIAKIECSYTYEEPESFRDKIICTENGWSEPKEPCRMPCGRTIDLLKQRYQIENDVSTDQTEAPWHVLIYNKTGDHYENICAGTLISPRYVVSAAICFFDTEFEAIASLKKNWSTFSVAAGKYFRDYHKEETDMREIERRNITSVFSSRGDILLIKLDRFVVFSDKIQPVCLYAHVKSKSVPSKLQGQLSAWSQISESNSESTRQTLKMTTISHDKCNKTSAERLNEYKGEKYCLTYNETEAFDCNGISGSGFVAGSSDSTFGLVGIVNFSPKEPQNCNQDPLLVAIDALFYYTWLQYAVDQDLQNDIDTTTLK